jgi:hypothetical protein
VVAVTAAARLERRVRLTLQQLRGASELAETSRTTLLALSEYARRVGGDSPGGGAALDLALYELRVLSQNGEDGVLAEILRRCGSSGKTFVEFGAGFGVENNCVLLADVLGWSGLFMEGGDAEYATLERKYHGSPRVSTEQAIVTPANVESLFARHGVADELDVLSIDVDGSDYWIWEALEAYRARVVVIEYNGALEPGRALVQPRGHPGWDATTYYGASVEALTSLGEHKGYRLVHTDLTGNNAFLVRADLPGDFPSPEDVLRRRSNFFLAGHGHRPDELQRPFVDVT